MSDKEFKIPVETGLESALASLTKRVVNLESSLLVAIEELNKVAILTGFVTGVNKDEVE